MIAIDRFMSSGVILWPFGGTARSTTSRPPWRSSPRVGFLWIGEPGTASMIAPISAIAIAPMRRRYLRRSLTCGGRLAVVFGLRRLVRLGIRLVGLYFRLGGRDDGADRLAGDANLELRGDADHHVVVVHLGHLAVDAAGGEHLGADLDGVEHPGGLLLA